MTYYPNVPVRDPRAGTSGERTARILCIVIAVLTVVISFPILVTTQTSVSHESDAAPPPSGPSRAQVLAAFPTPPGTTPVSVVADRQEYRVGATLAGVKSFYEQRLPALQVAWNHVAPDLSYVGTRQITTGWIGDLYGSHGTVDFALNLSLVDGNFAQRAPGTITILVAPR